MISDESANNEISIITPNNWRAIIKRADDERRKTCSFHRTTVSPNTSVDSSKKSRLNVRMLCNKRASTQCVNVVRHRIYECQVNLLHSRIAFRNAEVSNYGCRPHRVYLNHDSTTNQARRSLSLSTCHPWPHKTWTDCTTNLCSFCVRLTGLRQDDLIESTAQKMFIWGRRLGHGWITSVVVYIHTSQLNDNVNYESGSAS